MGKKRIKSLPLVCGIYRIVSPSNRIYVGQSYDIHSTWHTRYRPLRCAKQPLIYRSLKKYGHEKHKFEIIHVCQDTISQKELDALEKNYIFLFDTFQTPHGLNLSEGGATGKLSEETKLKQSLASKGKPKSEQHIEKVRQANIGKKHTAETIKKMSIASKGRVMSYSAKQKCRDGKLGNKNPAFGKSPSAETKKKQSETHKRIGSRPPVMIGANNPAFGKSPSAETREKLRIANVGKKYGEETKNKKSKSLKKMYENMTDTAKIKRSESLKSAWVKRKLEKQNKISL